MVRPGQDFGRYTLLSTLGRGGFATVYRAHDQALGREVAIKVLLPHLAEDADVRQRFTAEARGIARLRHPNIATIYDVGETDGLPYFTMELIQGPTLAQLVAGTAGLEPDRVFAILGSLCAAVDYLHGAGLVHRDVKPANVMLDDATRVVLMDFGIARAIDQTGQTRTGISLGTPEYMSPEQVRGEHVGPASDIYALGVLAYHLLCGRPPFQGDTAYLLFAHLYEPLPSLEERRPGLPAPVYASVASALAKDAAGRPATASAFAGALAATAAPATPPVERPDWPEEQAVNVPRPPTPGPPVASTSTRPGVVATEPAHAVPTDATDGRPTGSVARRRPAGAIAAALIALAILIGGGIAAAALTRGGSTHARPKPPPTSGAAVATAAAVLPVATSSPVVALPAGTGTPFGVATAPSSTTAQTATAAVPTATPAAGPRDPALQQLIESLVLKDADIGSGFSALNADDTQPATAGDVASYGVSYANLDLTNLNVRFVSLTLDAFTDDRAAGAAVGDAQQEISAVAGSELTFAAVSGGPKLGDEVVTRQVSGSQDGIAVGGYAVVWRRGRYRAVLVDFAYPTATPLADVAALASKQDDRLKTAPQ